jgi:hypothetical protein
MKDLERLVPGFSVSALRDAAARYLASGQLPAAPTAQAVPPPPAVATATPHAPKGTGEEGGAGPTPLPAGQILPAVDIKGSMTLGDVAQQTGVPLDKLLAALKLPANTRPEMQLKTLTQSVPGFEVQAVRDAVIALQQK